MKRLSIIRHALVVAATMVVAAAATSCSDAENEYSSYPCRFVFNTARHGQSAALMSAMTGTGVFCKVTTVMEGGARYYRFSNNAGLTDKVLFTKDDQETTVLLGTNSSIIVLFVNLDAPKQIYAYDGECPNCFSPEAIPVKSRPLTLTPAGLATCAVCHREYTLNGGGGVVSGDRGARLRRFHASWSADGVLAVVN